MALILPDVGEVKLVSLMLGKDATENFTLKLYSNTPTLTETSILADFTECTGSSYAAKTLTSASWTVTANAGVTTAGAARADYAAQTFTLTGALTANGYYVVGATSGVLLWAEAFGSTYTIPAGGGTITVTPRFELS